MSTVVGKTESENIHKEVGDQEIKTKYNGKTWDQEGKECKIWKGEQGGRGGTTTSNHKILSVDTTQHMQAYIQLCSHHAVFVEHG